MISVVFRSIQQGMCTDLGILKVISLSSRYTFNFDNVSPKRTSSQLRRMLSNAWVAQELGIIWLKTIVVEFRCHICSWREAAYGCLDWNETEESTHLVGEEHVVDDGVVSDKLFLLLLHRFSSRSSLLDPLTKTNVRIEITAINSRYYRCQRCTLYTVQENMC